MRKFHHGGTEDTVSEKVTAEARIDRSLIGVSLPQRYNSCKPTIVSAAN